MRGVLDGLLHAQVEHDLAGAGGNLVGDELAVEALDLGAGAGTRVARAAEDLHRLARAKLEHRRRLRLKQRDGPAQAHDLLRVRQRLHLVGHQLQLRLRRLDLMNRTNKMTKSNKIGI